MSETLPTRLGLIAGNGQLPLMLARQAKEMGAEELVVVGFRGETLEEVSQWADEVVWIKVGQLGKMIRALADRNIKHCVMAGQIAPKNLFDLRPDLRAIRVLAGLRLRHAHSIFAAVGDELKKDGVELISGVPWLKPFMPGYPFSIGPKLSESEREDIRYGFRLAKEISRLDIGQLVVVKEGSVLAVEGFEGTDACLTRGGQLAGPKGGAVAVKVAKEGHDMRFDIPCIGVRTLETCQASKIRVLALEAEKTLLLEENRLSELARKFKITITTALDQ